MKTPRFGPKVTSPPEGLDEDAQERLDEFIRVSEDGKVVRTRRLIWLAVMASPPVSFEGTGRFKNTYESVTLSPHTMVMTQQQYIGAERVNYYVEVYRGGEEVTGVRVTDSGPGGWWHLDGLHRLLAARILGLEVVARIYR